MLRKDKKKKGKGVSMISYKVSKHYATKEYGELNIRDPCFLDLGNSGSK
jgi:hypothetical protein